MWSEHAFHYRLPQVGAGRPSHAMQGCLCACQSRSRIAATDFAIEPCKAETTCPPTHAMEASAPVEFTETLTHKNCDGHREARPTKLPTVASYQRC